MRERNWRGERERGMSERDNGRERKVINERIKNTIN